MYNPSGGRGYGRGGRGRGHSRGKSRGGRFNRPNNTSGTNKEIEKKFSPQNQGKTQYATYATTRDAVIQHIQKTYKGGQGRAKSLEDRIVIDLNAQEPQREISQETDPADKIVIQAGLNIKYQEELRRHLDRKDALKEGLNKAFALIYTNYCTKTMQSRIEEHPDYQSTLKNDPIAVLEAIKLLMHDTVRAQYPMVSMSDALDRMINVKQQDNESLLDYVKRFKQLRDVSKSQLGNTFLDTFVEHQAEYPTAKDEVLNPGTQQNMKTEAFEKWMISLLIRGSDQTKYGTLLRGFISQYSLGNNQYPANITTATDVLSNHKLDQQFYNNQKKNRERSREERNKNENGNNPTSFAQSEMTCYCCGKKGHLSPECEKRNTIPRDQWHVNRAIRHHQEADGDDDANDNGNADTGKDDDSVQTTASSTSSQNRRSGTTTRSPRNTQSTTRSIVRWNDNGVNAFQFQQRDNDEQQGGTPYTHLRNMIILDTGSTMNATFMNPDLVTDIRVTKAPITMTTDTGTKKIYTKVTVPGVGQTWFDPNQIANIFGFSHMVDKHRRTFDSDREDAFLVHSNEEVIKFERTEDGLYVYKPTAGYTDQVAAMNETISTNKNGKQMMISTVKENRKEYTQRQFENAKRADDSIIFSDARQSRISNIFCDRTLSRTVQ
jgi:hypothetical protein